MMFFGRASLKWRCSQFALIKFLDLAKILSLLPPVSLSLSLSLSQTHTHTYTYILSISLSHSFLSSFSPSITSLSWQNENALPDKNYFSAPLDISSLPPSTPSPPRPPYVPPTPPLRPPQGIKYHLCSWLVIVGYGKVFVLINLPPLHLCRITSESFHQLMSLKEKSFLPKVLDFLLDDVWDELLRTTESFNADYLQWSKLRLEVNFSGEHLWPVLMVP